MTHDLYQMAVGDSSALKIRAKALLAEGGERQQWEAVMLFHEAARVEKRALTALDNPSPQIRLRSIVERCGCLLDGMDLPAAAQVRGEILELAAEFDVDSRAVLLGRIEKRFSLEVARFQKAVKQAPAFNDARAHANLVPDSSNQRAKLRREFQTLLREFPGTPFLWWGLYRNCEADKDLRGAWTALEKAAEIDPDNSTYAAMKLWLGPKVLGRAKTTELLALAYWSLPKASAEVCLQYALAMYRLDARPDSDQVKRIRRALNEGESRPGVPDRLRNYLRGVAYALEETIEGRKPTLDVLYRAGLGDLAVSIAGSHRNLDPVAVLGGAANRLIESSAPVAAQSA